MKIIALIILICSLSITVFGETHDDEKGNFNTDEYFVFANLLGTNPYNLHSRYKKGWEVSSRKNIVS